jgi:type IV secretory pathway VirJ component
MGNDHAPNVLLGAEWPEPSFEPASIFCLVGPVRWMWLARLCQSPFGPSLMIPNEQKFDLRSWQTCLLILLLFPAGCAQADSRADQQLSLTRPTDRLPGPRLTAEVVSMATEDDARRTLPNEGSPPKKAAPKPSAQAPRPATVNGTRRPYEEPIGRQPSSSRERSASQTSSSSASPIREEPATSRSPLPARRPVVPASATGSRVEASPQLSGDRREIDIHFARFLVKAGLSPMGVESLREIIKGSPGTQAARDAQKLLDSIAKTK